MRQIARRAVALVVMIALFLIGVCYLGGEFAVKGDQWATYPTNRHLYTNGELTKAGTVYDTNGTVLAETVDGVRSFSSNIDIRRATFHAVGDLSGKVATGLHNAFLNQLTGYDPVNGTYNTSGEGNDITLTLDADLCVTAYKALGSYSGTVGVYNYKTGELICMVSTPTADPENLPEEAPEGLYVNRLLNGSYTPGSTFKVVTAVGALTNFKDAETRTFLECHKGVDVEGEWLSCLGNHGALSLGDALVHSCNVYFGQLAVSLGRSSMTSTANKLGFNRTWKLDGITCTSSCYQVSEARNIELAWSGMGQYTDTVNPYHYLILMGAIANDGRAVMPYLVKKANNAYGFPTRLHVRRYAPRMMSTQVAQTMQTMMRNDVLQNYGDSNFSGLELCGKTGTAEIGKNDSPHSWFVGFSQREDKPYAFVVVAENAGAGIKVAARIANQVLQAAPTVS